MTRDEVRYPDAEKFIPERFLDAEGRLTDDDPREFIFGFGRRICPGWSFALWVGMSPTQDILSFPGRHIADMSVWIAVATMLATLDFHLAKDADGNDITFKATFKSGITEYVLNPPYFVFDRFSEPSQTPQSFPLSTYASGTCQQRDD